MKTKILFLFFILFITSVFSQNKVDVFFDFNKDIPNQKSILSFNDWIKNNKNVVVEKLHGYCDSVDVSSYNKELSLRRINSILKILEENKIAISETLEKKPFGKDFELSNEQYKNRKVTLYFNKIKEDKSIENNEIIIDDEKIIAKFKKAKKGDLIRLFNINFKFNSEKINPDSEQILLDLFEALYKYPKLRIAIHGHICCNPNINDVTLSYRRAKFIFDFLIKHGINAERLSYRGFGSARPIYEIPEKNVNQELANRRVEILIVETIL
ncbi:OmpA family protein [Flavobacterium sp.]|uniref:OmpA family protein n=1 Tax=Flavobacterium sp. TaxID=239 RepID=UPI003750D63B